MGEPAPVHYLRENAKVWTPPHVVFLDSETGTTTVGDVEVLELRLWVATLVDRRDARKTSGPIYSAGGEDPGSLASQLDAWSRGRRALWVYAHNLSFDLVTTGLPVHLTGLGWRVTEFALRSQSPWVRLTNGKATITLVDSWSWLSVALADVAALYGDAKEPLPSEEAPMELWWARCSKDVQLLARAMCDLMDWWDRNRLGRWTISGAASGWNAMRHRPSRYRILVDPDPETLAHDRLAIRGGRRDVTRVGDLGFGDYVEVDFMSAYATVAANLPLPYRRGGGFDSLPTDHYAVADDRWGFIAEVTIQTDSPRYPVKHGGVTWYPVGEFRTTLASPEVAWARDNGDLMAIGPGRFHRLGWALTDWANWILEVESGQDPDSPQVARTVAHQWGRAVVGKFAAHTSERVALGPWAAAWGYEGDGWDSTSGQPAAMVDMCGQRWWTWQGSEGENTYPAVLAWVESHVRARVGVLLEVIPQGCWVQVDTDGAILDMSEAARWVKKHGVPKGRTRDGWGVAADWCEKAAPATWPLVARPKRQHRTMRVLGAQQVVTDQARKMAGVRRDAVEVEPNRWVARDWPSLAWQLQHGRPGAYLRPERTTTFAKPLAHRWVTEGGEAWPVWCRLDSSGANELVPWSQSWGNLVDLRLAPAQYAGLSGLY